MRDRIRIATTKMATTGFALGCLAATIGQASAQSAIGGASLVENDVNGVRQGAAARLGQGDSVFQNEIVRTGSNSLARLTFLDSTNVSLAASSQLVLDRFVYNGDQTAKEVGFNVLKGSFRFISGSSPSAAYKVVTPVAVIGVRGTVYDVQVSALQTDVVLISGVVQVCLRQGGRPTGRCVELRDPCDSVTVTSSAIGRLVPPGERKWSFDASCASARDFWRPDAPEGNGGSGYPSYSPPPSRSNPSTQPAGPQTAY